MKRFRQRMIASQAPFRFYWTVLTTVSFVAFAIAYPLTAQPVAPNWVSPVVAGIFAAGAVMFGMLAIGYYRTWRRPGSPNSSQKTEGGMLGPNVGCLAEICSWLLPKWFRDQFGPSLVADLVDLATDMSKELGGRWWWVALALEVFKLVFKFGLKRFHKYHARKATVESFRDDNTA